MYLIVFHAFVIDTSIDPLAFGHCILGLGIHLVHLNNQVARGARHGSFHGNTVVAVLSYTISRILEYILWFQLML